MDDVRSFNYDNWLDDHGWVILWTVIVAFAAFFLLKRTIRHLVRPAVARQMVERPREEIERRTTTLTNVITSTAKVVIITLSVLTILPELGIDTRALLAGVSIGSLAISFGAQSLVRDTLNGLFILGENQFTIGETVTIAGVTGTVEEVSLRKTTLRDVEGTIHVVPNGTITTASNHTRDYAKIRVIISIAPSSDLDVVREISDRIGRELAAEPHFAAMIVEAPSFFRIESTGERGAIGVNVNGTAVPGRQWEVRGELRERLIAAFQAAGITVR